MGRKLAKKIGWKNWAWGKNWAKNWVENWAEKLGKKLGKFGESCDVILICDHTIIKRLFCAKSWDELMNFIESMNQ